MPEINEGGVDLEWTDWTESLRQPLYEFNKHSSAVTHFDFSVDCKYTQVKKSHLFICSVLVGFCCILSNISVLQSTCQAGELLFLDIEHKKQETSATKMAEYNGVVDDEAPDRQWATQTCVLGWTMQGVWTPDQGLSDINAADRHRNGKLLATADDNGLVCLRTVNKLL